MAHTNSKKSENEDMSYIQFKMETLQSVLSLITPGCYLASQDLKDACYSVPIHPDHTGIYCGPRKFRKLMKPSIGTSRLDGHIIVIYFDDLINVGLTFDECVKNFTASIKLLNSLGFIIHPDKSMFLPK